MLTTRSTLKWLDLRLLLDVFLHVSLFELEG